MIKYFLVFSLAIPLCGHCQSYVDSPFYRPTSAIPSTAHVEGYSHGSLRANGIVIDLSESVPSSSPDFDEIRGWSVQGRIDGIKPAQTFHFYIQYNRLNVVFGYDLLAEPLEGTDKIKCSFSALTDPPDNARHHNKEIAPVALPADLTPLVIKSGDAISITTLPLGEGKIAVIHYLRLTRTDLTPDSPQLALGTSITSAEPRIDLLQRVEHHFNNATSFDIMGIASATIPGSSWRATYEFETQGAQPAFLPLSLRGPSLKVISRVGKLTEMQINADATDPKPRRSFTMAPLGQYNNLARRLIDAQKIGTESITFQGRAHSCEIIDAVYDVSPEFKPHSKTIHKHFSIDPSDSLVLRETQSSPDGMEWTADVTSISFDLPPSEAMVQVLRNFANQAKDRPDWIGRSIPDLKLAQLSGSSVSLGELRGKPILLDFWGSYCGPCGRTTLHGQELANRYKSSGLIVLTVTQDVAQDAKLWTEHYQVNLPVLLDPDGVAFKGFDVQGVPVTILVDENGKVVHYWVGLEDPSSMDSVLSEKLQPRPISAVGSEQRH
jgi:peroxiredoxin